MASIKFDSVEILNTTYIPRFVKHETVADRLLTTLPRAREDGQTLIVERYGTKKIYLQGSLIGTSEADLDAKIDAFTELFSRQEKDLDVSWNTSTRRYVASCTQHTFDRDHYNISMVPWTAEFTVLSGVGKDTTTTTAANAVVLDTTTPATTLFILSGGTPPKPILTVDGNNAGVSTFPTGATGVEYMNTDTGEKMQIVYPSLSAGKIDIDCSAKTVQYTPNAGVPTDISFFGTFPTFKIGTNNVKITAGGLVNQSGISNGLATEFDFTTTTTYYAQSFYVPYTDDTFYGLQIKLRSVGTPVGTLAAEIHSDNGGIPSVLPIKDLLNNNVDYNFPQATTTNIFALLTQTPYYGNKYKLTAGVRYWLVMYSNATPDASNFYAISQVYNSYPQGEAKSSSDGGTTYPFGAPGAEFAILYGGNLGASSVKHSVVYTKKYL